jgi:hypothetical protein
VTGLLYDSKYIQSDAFLMACDSSDRLSEQLRQFNVTELRQMKNGCSKLAQACSDEIARKINSGETP